MNLLRLKFLLFALLSLVSAIFIPGCAMFDEQQGAFEQPADITQKELFMRMMETSDPTGIYSKSKSYIQRQEQEMSASDKKSYYIIEVKFKRPGKFKVTTFKAWKPVSALIFNGDQAWRVDYSAEKYLELEGVQLERAKLFFAMGQPGNQYSTIFPEIKLTEWINGAEQYYKLVCDAKIAGINPITIYVGKNNFLTKRLEINTITEDGVQPYVSTMEKYGLYEGVMIASLSSVKVRGMEIKYRMIDYRLNLDIPDSEFQPPVWK